MSSIIYSTIVMAALWNKAAAYPALYDEEKKGCTIPETGFDGHLAPEANAAITMTVMAGTTAVTEFVPGEEHTIEVQAYAGEVNMWIHATEGSLVGTDPAAHPQATACEEAAYSTAAAATHSFTWTAPDTSETVTISVAQAASASDAYNTATVDMPARAAEAPGTAESPAGGPVAGMAPLATEPPLIAEAPRLVSAGAPVATFDPPGTADESGPSSVSATGTTLENATGSAAPSADPVPAPSAAASLTKSVLAAAAAALVALAL